MACMNLASDHKTVIWLRQKGSVNKLNSELRLNIQKESGLKGELSMKIASCAQHDIWLFLDKMQGQRLKRQVSFDSKASDSP